MSFTALQGASGFSGALRFVGAANSDFLETGSGTLDEVDSSLG